MSTVFMTDPDTGRAALFDEPTTSGEASDPNSPRNAPLNNPDTNLQFIRFHSDFDYMETSLGPNEVIVNHPTISAGGTPGSGQIGIDGVIYYSNSSVDHVLATHNLGYIPVFFVISDEDIVYSGQPIQFLPDGRTRKITAIATTTQIILREWSARTSVDLPSISKTYTVVVFRQPPPPSGNILFDFNPITGIVEMGLGKFNSERAYLQTNSTNTGYGFSLGRSIDLQNGAPRYVDPDSTITDPVPTTTSAKIRFTLEPNTAAFGPSLGYTGSFLGSPSIEVVVP